MDLNALKALDSNDIDRLIEAMTIQMIATQTGDRSGYGQELNDELNDIRSLLAKLRAAR